jgi:copper chaperone CopZ
MDRILLTLTVLVTLSASALAETVKVTVNGMVCAFCATAIEKTFKKEPQVETVYIDLPKKLVTIKTKPGTTISDAKIHDVISYAGYTHTNIVRAGR